MNRSELAALFAANPPVPASSSPVMCQDHMQSPAASSPNSPRLEFQSRVRKLQLSPRPSLRKHRHTHSEPEHVSTLRLTHKRSRSAQPASEDTPNFLAEEREAWGRRSPEAPPLQVPFNDAGTIFPSRPKLQPFPSPPPRNPARPMLQPRKQSRERAPRQIFAPLNTTSDVNERPKTSRGPRKLEMLEEENEEDTTEGETEDEHKHDVDEDNNDVPRLSTSTKPTSRTSKFIEGSMNERSSGIASSWFREALSESDKPLPPTPAVKHVTFSCTPVREALDETREPVSELPTTTKRKERRGLRRSISNFNFQALSGKMKLFSSSGHEVAPAEQGEKKRPAQKSDATDLNTLNERKRKADEAYAAQFGSKRQRFSGPPSSISTNAQSLQGQIRNIDQTSDVRTSTTTFNATSNANPDLRKKKSRRELERENAELRARLDAQQNFRDIQPQRHITEVDIPPVPKVLGRGVLTVLENMQPNSDWREAGSLGGKRNWSAVRSNGDGEGLNDDAGPKVAPSLLAMGYARSPDANTAAKGRKSFEWPEDVF
ncbi:hypothetical protein EPUS_04467 [Endocarpon pusillum Z07020]|uniref:Uncharacterized protein n=1 Tax=Endocarpon pusillum (strain Z07020 / HMAS-L-300199) TaxID=1263415 RepID=U1GG70_ENDPU|nr:uncharacterized protein EPUS_04467 [Endocarpon pusillum Z07020]ERF76647.1 hypothetical protein EPUS_04467 [Endocarpon pusillum Z07020]